MTPHSLAHLRSSQISPDAEYHVRTTSGDLHTGRILPAMDKEVLVMVIKNSGPAGFTGDLGTHQIWLAVEYIESIEETS